MFSPPARRCRRPVSGGAALSQRRAGWLSIDNVEKD